MATPDDSAEIARLRADNAALLVELEALADANARFADLTAQLFETRASEAELRRHGEEHKIRLALAGAIVDARDPVDLLCACLCILQLAVILEVEPVAAYLRDLERDHLRRVEPDGDHDLPEAPASLAPPHEPDPSVVLAGDILTLWLFGQGRCLGALRLRAPTEAVWYERWRRPLTSISAQIAIALDRAVIVEANMEMAGQLLAARDQALQASLAKSRLLANVSHELRTPLNAIIGYTELIHDLCREAGHDDYVPDLKRIVGASRHLLGLIEGLLDISRIESGRTELRPERVDLRAMLGELHDLVIPLALARNNRLAFDTEGAPAELVADAQTLRQCLINLLGNACKYTDHGRVNLRVTRDDERVHFAVEDTGIGIDPSQHSAIFEAFVRADDPEALRRGGTGLGLAITRRLVELMGGQLTLRSAPGRGSCFVLSLPLTPPASLVQ